jgi:hypothetical protein
VPFSLGEAYFHKIEDRETLSTSHNDLNTTDNNVGLSNSFSAELHMQLNLLIF